MKPWYTTKSDAFCYALDPGLWFGSFLNDISIRKRYIHIINTVKRIKFQELEIEPAHRKKRLLTDESTNLCEGKNSRVLFLVK